MVQTASYNRQKSPRRPVDWRWNRAGELLEINGRTRRNKDAEGIHKIKRFRRLVERATKRSQHDSLLVDFPHIYEAWSMYVDEEREARWEVEARLLAREPVDTIAAKLMMEPEAIQAYEQYFFNVADRLGAPGYITHRVFGKCVQMGLAERDYDCLWKLMGYWHGPLAVDAVVYRALPRPHADNHEMYLAGLADDIHASVALKASIAARNLKLNQDSQADVLAAYQKYIELEKDTARGGTASILDNIFAMTHEMPWSCRVVPQAETNVDRFEADGVTLRACELSVGTTSEGVPEALRLLAESAHYPEDENEQVGT